MIGSIFINSFKDEKVKKFYTYLVILSASLSILSYFFNSYAILDNFMGDQYMLMMIILKQNNPSLFPGHIILSDPVNTQYYIPLYVSWLNFLYALFKDPYVMMKIQNSILIFIYLISFGTICYYLTKKIRVSLFISAISCLMFAWIYGGEAWGLFIHYNSSARSVFAVLLMVLICLFFIIKPTTNYFYNKLLFFLFLGLVAQFHPPTSLITGVTAVVFLFFTDLYRGNKNAFLSAVINSLIFFLIFYLYYYQFTQSFRNFASSGILPVNNEFTELFSSIRGMKDTIAKKVLLLVFKEDYIFIYVLIFTVISVVNFIYLLLALINNIKINNNFILISGLLQIPFIIISVCIPLIVSGNKFPVFYELFSFFGFSPVIIFALFMRKLLRNNYSDIDFSLYLLMITLITCSYCILLISHYAAPQFSYTPVRAVRFYYPIMFLMLLILMNNAKKYVRFVYIFISIYLCYHILYQEAYMKLVPDTILKVFYQDERVREIKSKSWMKFYGRLADLDDIADWIRINTSPNSSICFLTDNFYYQTPRLAINAKRTLLIDQTYVFNIAITRERMNKYGKAIKGIYPVNIMAEEYDASVIVISKQLHLNIDIPDYKLQYENGSFYIFTKS